MKKILTILFLGLFAFNTFADTPAVESYPGEFDSEFISGEVISVNQDENGLDTYFIQLETGARIDINTFGEDLEKGNKVYVEYFPFDDSYNFVTIKRNNPIIFLALIFVLAIILLAGRKGVRSLGGLLLSILLLFMGLVPLLLLGWNPILVTLVFGLCVLFLSIFVTHGFNHQSLVSFLGSFFSILVAVILLAIITQISSLTGLISDEIQFLSLESQNVLNLVRIVNASIIIGILGVLDDITVTQVAVVRELSSDKSLESKNIFSKALRVGRDHVSSLVNTLVFAYVGATLPTIMFIALLDVPFGVLMSHEFIFIEITRSLIGAIALTLAVPLTTWLASYPFLQAINKDAAVVEHACAHRHEH
jgi:uncharacterized membrane protein